MWNQHIRNIMVGEGVLMGYGGTYTKKVGSHWSSIMSVIMCVSLSQSWHEHELGRLWQQLSFYTVSGHHVTDRSKTTSLHFDSQVKVKSSSFCFPPAPTADEALLDKGSLCLKGLWFPWACGRCCIPNKPCTHNLQTDPGRGVRDHSLLSFPLCFWQPANSIPALWRCHNL